MLTTGRHAAMHHMLTATPSPFAVVQHHATLLQTGNSPSNSHLRSKFQILIVHINLTVHHGAGVVTRAASAVTPHAAPAALTFILGVFHVP